MPQTEEEHLYGLELEETESMEEGGINRSHLNLVETNLDVCIKIKMFNTLTISFINKI